MHGDFCEARAIEFEDGHREKEVIAVRGLGV
jgi:hypothetical protein